MEHDLPLAKTRLFVHIRVFVEVGLIHQKYCVINSIKILIFWLADAREVVMPLVSKSNQPSMDSIERHILFCPKN